MPKLSASAKPVEEDVVIRDFLARYVPEGAAEYLPPMNEGRDAAEQLAVFRHLEEVREGEAVYLAEIANACFRR